MKKKTEPIKPFLRWAGGKQWIAARLASMIPSDSGIYYEPFLGGGSVYFATLPSRAVLSDLNGRLVETYRVLRDNPLAVTSVLQCWSNDEFRYYNVRASEYQDEAHRAAQFIYLNRTCWNGLYRVNKQGTFNVPFANHGRAIFNTNHLLQVSYALRGTELQCSDFEYILRRAQPRDFVYLDPPYTTLGDAGGFSKYNVDCFTWNDQLRLGHVAVTLAKRGCYVLVSNVGQKEILELYPGFLSKEMVRHSIIAASSKFRKVTNELLLASEPELFRSFCS